jgi:hypothetical protein
VTLDEHTAIVALAHRQARLLVLVGWATGRVPIAGLFRIAPSRLELTENMSYRRSRHLVTSAHD